MFEFLRREAILSSLKICLKHPAPAEPFENKERYYIAFLTHRKERYTIVVDELCATMIKGRKYLDSQFIESVEAPIHSLHEFSIEVFSRFRGYTKTHNSALSFAFREWMKLRYFSVFANWIQQKTYNSTNHFSSHRIELLKKLFSLNLQKADAIQENMGVLFSEEFGQNDLDLFFEIYGNRVSGHPKFNREFAQFKLLLSSLVATEDLAFENHKYSVGKNAIRTIEEFDRNEQRHTDNKWHSNAIFALTVVIAVSTAIGVWLDWKNFSSTNVDPPPPPLSETDL